MYVHACKNLTVDIQYSYVLVHVHAFSSDNLVGISEQIFFSFF